MAFSFSIGSYHHILFLYGETHGKHIAFVGTIFRLEFVQRLTIPAECSMQECSFFRIKRKICEAIKGQIDFLKCLIRLQYNVRRGRNLQTGMVEGISIRDVDCTYIPYRRIVLCCSKSKVKGTLVHGDISLNGEPHLTDNVCFLADKRLFRNTCKMDGEAVVTKYDGGCCRIPGVPRNSGAFVRASCSVVCVISVFTFFCTGFLTGNLTGCLL